MFQKLWDAHFITTRESGDVLLYVDRHLIHDLHFRAFDTLTAAGHKIREPRKLFGLPDHRVRQNVQGQPGLGRMSTQKSPTN